MLGEREEEIIQCATIALTQDLLLVSSLREWGLPRDETCKASGL